MNYEEVLAVEARNMGIGLALSWQAARAPYAPALTMGERTYTRLTLDRAANRMARHLANLGIGQDGRVAVVLPTGPDHQIACFAAWKLGASVIPISPRLLAHELLEILASAQPGVVIGAAGAGLSEYLTIPQGFEPDLTLSDEPLPEAVAASWKAACSGGSTGVPKLIWENRPALINPTAPYSILRLQPGAVMLHPAAAYHNATFTQTNWGLCWGCHIVLMDRFDAREWLRTVERLQVEWAYMVPTMMGRVLALSESERLAADLSSLSMVIHMAAPCPPWVKQAWIEWVGAEAVWEIYGGTEGYGATIISGTEWLAHPGSVGKVPPGTTIRDDDGELLSTGEVGTVYFTPPPNNPIGHSQKPHTFGDLGLIDADDYLYLSDRRTDMILTGGVNLYPAEIEGVIEQWPGVIGCAIVGLPDNDLGAKAHAIIQYAEGEREPDLTALSAFLAEELSAAKIPCSCEFTTEPLRDDAGKLRRKRLRDERIDRADLQRLPLRPLRHPT